MSSAQQIGRKKKQNKWKKFEGETTQSNLKGEEHHKKLKKIEWDDAQQIQWERAAWRETAHNKFEKAETEQYSALLATAPPPVDRPIISGFHQS